MSFNSVSFLFMILPLSVLLYVLIPGRGKLAVMFVTGLLFYGWGGPKELVLLLLTIAFHYGAGAELFFLKQGKRHKQAKLMLVFAVACDIALLCVYKYSGAGLPLGISFYTFSELSYLFDIYYGKAEAEKNPFKLSLYVSFFPKVTSGPIVKYADFSEQLDSLRFDFENISDGTALFLKGLFKKVLIADNLGVAFASVTELNLISGATAWLGMIFYSLQLYYDFSGYSDMAIGLAKVFGFSFDKNFDYPYMSKSISEFWRRWHISLGAWFRDYVYIPLGGNRVSSAMLLRNLLVVWLLTGIWHGSTGNFVVWGLYHGFFVILERFVIKDSFDGIPSVIRIIITDFIAFVGWVFFFSDSLPDALYYIMEMFGADGLGFFDKTAFFLFFDNLFLLIVAIALATPFPKLLHDKLAYEKGGVWRVLSVVAAVVLMILAVSGIIGSTYTTFLYFKF